MEELELKDESIGWKDGVLGEGMLEEGTKILELGDEGTEAEGSRYRSWGMEILEEREERDMEVCNREEE